MIDHKWARRFLGIAKEVALWSKDPSTKCGAVIVRPDKTIASLGFNGFPRGMNDDPELYANRDVKLDRTIHAEINAIHNAHEVVRGYTLVTWPIPCCNHCAIQVIQAGISVVMSPHPIYPKYERWEVEFQIAQDYFAEAGVKTIWL